MRCDNVNPLDVHEINRRSVSNANTEETVVSIGPIYMKKKPKPEEIQSLILENEQPVNVKRGIFTGLLIHVQFQDRPFLCERPLSAHDRPDSRDDLRPSFYEKIINIKKTFLLIIWTKLTC